MYAMGILPLVRQVNHIAHQLWFADDASAGGSLADLHLWWSKLSELGPSFGYHPKASKSWLVVKDEHAEEARNLFSDLGVNVTTSGHQHLGSAIGEEDFVDLFLKKKVDGWLKELSILTEIARTEPHAAYSGFVLGFKHKLTYTLRTAPCSSELLSPIEDLIRNRFIPALTGRSMISDAERQLLALPPKLGGLGITNPTQTSTQHYEASQEFCTPVVNCIMNQERNVDNNILAEQSRIKMKIKSEKRTKDADNASSINLPEHLNRAAELARDKGASSWLTTLPLEKYGFHLSKSEFRDALALRYAWVATREVTVQVCM